LRIVARVTSIKISDTKKTQTLSGATEEKTNGVKENGQGANGGAPGALGDNCKQQKNEKKGQCKKKQFQGTGRVQ